jgi:hypothetical protein
MSRATRLAEIKAKLTADLGYNADTLDGADKERIEHAALLKLRYEITAARLVEGSGVATDELVRLTEAVDRTLPAKAPKPIQVTYVDPRTNNCTDAELATLNGIAAKLYDECSEDDAIVAVIKKENRELKAENADLRRALETGVSRSTADQTTAPAASPEASSVRTTLPEQQNADPSNVVPFVGNGSCAIDTPLENRYPHLRDTPPVGRW